MFLIFLTHIFWYFIFTVPPMIWVPNQLIGASIGEEVTLECSTEAFPLSLNYWTKEDTFMIVNSDKYKMSNSENAYKVHMKLTIKKISAEDYGKRNFFKPKSRLFLRSINPLFSALLIFRIIQMLRQEQPWLNAGLHSHLR